MTVNAFTAQQLFDWLVDRDDFLLLDVRNEDDFSRSKVEGPYPIDMLNIPYFDFIEEEDASVARVPKGKKVRIVCAKEGSSKYVGDILENHGFSDVGNLKVGIRAWGNLLTPVQVAQTDDYALYQFRRPGKASCSYGLVCGKEMMVFDPAKNISAYIEFARDKGCSIVKNFETHRQADYISGSPMLNQTAGAQILTPQPDFDGAKFAFTPVADGDIHRFSSGGPEVRVIHTPGHTPGSTSYLIDQRYLISGDTVFIQSIGRPDLGGMAKAWSQMLFQTVQNKLLPLSDDLIVLPGHYMNWQEADENLVFAATMGDIKKRNADIYGIDNADDFFAFIQANMRTQPPEYAKIREINAGLLEVDEETQDIMDLGKNECAASA